jgi:hypothetical protein
VRAGEHPLELEPVHLPLDGDGVLGGLGARGVVARLLRELVQRPRVLERPPRPIEAADARLELRLLLQQPLRARVVVPERRVLGEARDLAGAVALPVDVKATP